MTFVGQYVCELMRLFFLINNWTGLIINRNNNHGKILRRWRFPVGDSTWYVWWWLHLCSMRLGLATCCTGFTYRNRGEKGEELGCDQPPVENLGFQYLEIDLNFSLVWFQKIEDFSPWCEIRKMRHGFSSPLWTPRGSGSILQLGPIILSQCFSWTEVAEGLKRPLNHFRKTLWAPSIPFTIILAAEKFTMTYTQFFSFS